jgi:cellulase/cellobiase CelA1
VALPAESKIHLVFHVSQLRRALLPGTTPSLVLPTPTDDIVVPIKILAQKWTRTPSGRRARVQVQWSNTASRDITWEDKLELKQRFLAAPAWGQAVSQEGGDVSVPPAPFNKTLARPRRLVQLSRRHLGPEWTT